MNKHLNADKKGLTQEEWWFAFVHEHNRRLGTMPEDMNEEDDLCRYYDLETTPTEGVNEDMEKFGLDEISQDIPQP